VSISQGQLAVFIEHTLLDATVTKGQVEQLCREAIDFGFYAVCVNPRWLPLVADLLHGSKIKVGGVVSLPLGADSTKIKVAQAKEAIFAGADEIDMVADMASIVEGDSAYLSHQIRSVLKVCRSMRPAVVLKVVIEWAALGQEQRTFACQVADMCGVDFIQTGTGLQPAGGPTVDDIKLMKETAPRCKIKAAGGIETPKQVIEMLDAGVERVGTCSGVRIIDEFRARQPQ